MCVCVCVGALAHQAVANVIGDINDIEFGIAHIYANMSRLAAETQVSAVVHDIPPQLGIMCHSVRLLMSLTLS